MVASPCPGSHGHYPFSDIGRQSEHGSPGAPPGGHYQRRTVFFFGLLGLAGVAEGSTVGLGQGAESPSAAMRSLAILRTSPTRRVIPRLSRNSRISMHKVRLMPVA